MTHRDAAVEIPGKCRFLDESPDTGGLEEGAAFQFGIQQTQKSLVVLNEQILAEIGAGGPPVWSNDFGCQKLHQEGVVGVDGKEGGCDNIAGGEPGREGDCPANFGSLGRGQIRDRSEQAAPFLEEKPDPGIFLCGEVVLELGCEVRHHRGTDCCSVPEIADKIFSRHRAPLRARTGLRNKPDRSFAEWQQIARKDLPVPEKGKTDVCAVDGDADVIFKGNALVFGSPPDAFIKTVIHGLRESRTGHTALKQAPAPEFNENVFAGSIVLSTLCVE
ncbi:MAG: hypothetical protein FWD68_10480 [Alphaproteobacteria bacterium]|nr:hypothetical protein [Alphaproteobacteria bacterium]